jgi:transposase
LRRNCTEYDPKETKPELLFRVAPYESQKKAYELDQIEYEMGHLVHRLPPYHCKYNPIVLIWAKVKGEVAQLNNTFRLSDVARLMKEAIDSVTKETGFLVFDMENNCSRRTSTKK